MRLLFDLFWLICFGGWLSFLISLPNIKKRAVVGIPVNSIESSLPTRSHNPESPPPKKKSPF